MDLYLLLPPRRLSLTIDYSTRLTAGAMIKGAFALIRSPKANAAVFGKKLLLTNRNRAFIYFPQKPDATSRRTMNKRVTRGEQFSGR